MEAETLYTRTHVMAAFFVGLIIGLGSFYIGANRDEAPVNKGGEAMDTQTMTDVTQSENSVMVSNQLEGIHVVVDKVVTENGGWIVIHEDAAGTPGNILGAQRVDAGTFTDVDVDLLRNTLSGRTYYAMLHADDGNKEFNHTLDLPMQNGSGNLVMVAFEAVGK